MKIRFEAVTLSNNQAPHIEGWWGGCRNRTNHLGRQAPAAGGERPRWCPRWGSSHCCTPRWWSCTCGGSRRRTRCRGTCQTASSPGSVPPPFYSRPRRGWEQTLREIICNMFRSNQLLTKMHGDHDFCCHCCHRCKQFVLTQLRVVLSLPQSAGRPE